MANTIQGGDFLNWVKQMKKNIADSGKGELIKETKSKSSFDWWLFSFITIVVILLVVLLSYK